MQALDAVNAENDRAIASSAEQIASLTIQARGLELEFDKLVSVPDGAAEGLYSDPTGLVDSDLIAIEGSLSAGRLKVQLEHHRKRYEARRSEVLAAVAEVEGGIAAIRSAAAARAQANSKVVAPNRAEAQLQGM